MASQITDLPDSMSNTRPLQTMQSKNSRVSVPQKQSRFKRGWKKLGFSPLVVTFMIKGALPPTIATAILQRQSVAQHYLNFGYLVIVISILSVPILPRGKFAMNMVASVVSFSEIEFVITFNFYLQRSKTETPKMLPELMKLILT